MRPEKLPALSADDLMKVWVNCLTHEDDPKFGAPARALQPKIREEFLRRERQSGSEFLPMLRCMGYHVRYSGFTEVARRKALRRILEDELPHINSPEYMRGWGAPGTKQRCREAQQTIHTYISRYGDEPHMSIAVERWHDDLQFLRAVEAEYQ